MSMFGNPTSRRANVFFSLLAAGPPIIISLFTDNVETLVSFTGGFAGLFIEFVLPAVLVQRSREFWRSRGAHDESGTRDSLIDDSEAVGANHDAGHDVSTSGAMKFDEVKRMKNPHRSIFRHDFWPILVLLFAAVGFIMISIETVKKLADNS